MGVIIPAIIPTSKQDLEDKLQELQGITDVAQVDAIDGKFAAPASWPYAGGMKEFTDAANRGEALPQFGRIKCDIDLMALDPERAMAPWITLGASRITIHAESTNYLSKLIADLAVRFGHNRDFAPDLLSFGLALGIRTDIALIEPYLSHIDYVQFMGIASIGKQGEPFDARVIERVKQFKKRYPKVTVQVDGGVTRATVPELLEAGVNRLIVGHDLWQAPNVRDEYEYLTSLTERYGRYDS